MNILGCDLSLNSSGLVLINDKNQVLWSDKVRPKNLKGMDRIVWLASAYAQRLQMLEKKFGPMDIVVEDLAKGSKNQWTLVALCQGSTAFQMMAHVLGYQPILASAPLCRKWLCGNGHADKDFVAARLKIDYGVEFDGDVGHDLSDAYLLAAWGNRVK